MRDTKQIIQDIRTERERRQWSRYRLAKESGVSQSMVKYVEEGGRPNPSVAVLSRLLGALDLGLTVAPK